MKNLINEAFKDPLGFYDILQLIISPLAIYTLAEFDHKIIAALLAFSWWWYWYMVAHHYMSKQKAERAKLIAELQKAQQELENLRQSIEYL